MDYPSLLLALDHRAFEFVNQFAGHYALADNWVKLISENALLKGAAVMAGFCFLWAGTPSGNTVLRNRLLALLVAAICALFLGRALALTLPFRVRPMHNEVVEYHLPIGLPETFFSDWSSFPSDHAVLYFAIAGGFFLFNRTLGWFALIHAVAVVSLPRIYLGFHFPSDILVGGLLGICMAAILVPVVGTAFEKGNIAGLAESRPGYFYPGLFLLTFLLATNFDSLRAIANAFIAMARQLA